MNSKDEDDAQHLQAQVLRLQQHQLNSAQLHVGKASNTLDALARAQARHESQLDELLRIAEALASSPLSTVEGPASKGIEITSIEQVLVVESEAESTSIALLEQIDYIDILKGSTWDDYVGRARQFADRNAIDLKEDPYRHLMTDSQRIALEKRIKDDFSLKGANCDKYDYMLAGACGLLGGMIDILLVGAPGKGALGKFTDDFADSAIRRFAKATGWNGPREGKDPTKSAIGFLERTFKVNYDHRHGGDVGGAFRMSSSNHHIKNLAHSPDIVGLFFSILDQFTSTAHFVDNGSLISINTKTFELKGSNFASNVFSGFVNWLGHLFSDAGGSSSSQGRGSGIPMPFYSLLQFVNIGSFGQYRQTFATIAVKVFEQGYDLRHGMAMAIPVVVTEVLTRLTWTVKQWTVHGRQLSQCLPVGSVPELRRMLLISHGSLCLVDVADAGVRSCGEIVTFLLHGNMVAWARFGTTALTELKAWYAEGSLDVDAVDAYLEAEYARLLA